ncbi:MAG TPA: hypothetical protein VJJ75_03185 [Candidatus Nanoarchaeia archaeon]|nr:hypothetical protein [Candidatus Nanoarchaeia archaeon]
MKTAKLARNLGLATLLGLASCEIKPKPTLPPESADLTYYFTPNGIDFAYGKQIYRIQSYDEKGIPRYHAFIEDRFFQDHTRRETRQAMIDAIELNERRSFQLNTSIYEEVELRDPSDMQFTIELSKICSK